jgi:fatty acid CoA ligase FadD9
MGRMTLLKVLLTGGQIYFVRSPDMSTFFDDLRAVRPTEGMFPPRLINMLHDRFNEMLSRLPAPASDEEREQQRRVRPADDHHIVACISWHRTKHQSCSSEPPL